MWELVIMMATAIIFSKCVLSHDLVLGSGPHELVHISKVKPTFRKTIESKEAFYRVSLYCSCQQSLLYGHLLFLSKKGCYPWLKCDPSQKKSVILAIPYTAEEPLRNVVDFVLLLLFFFLKQTFNKSYSDNLNWIRDSTNLSDASCYSNG